jgi:hypothetical protein
LLDKQTSIQEEVDWLKQVLSLLTISCFASDPTQDPNILDVAKIITEKKAILSGIVSYWH